MEALLAVLVILFCMLSVLIALSFVFSSDEFANRHHWRIVDTKGNIDWRRVDSGRFAIFFLVRIWQMIASVLLISYIMFSGSK